MSGKQIPEKCRLCAKLTATQAKQLHSVDGDGCWDSTVCPSRRCRVRLAPSDSHVRHRDRRNQARDLKRWSKQGQVALTLTDSEIAPMQEHRIADAGSHSRIQFETQLPNFNSITQIVQQRSLLTLEEIDSLMQESGPVVPADFFDKFVRQSMHVDFAQFVESPLPLPRQVSQTSERKFPNDGRSVVGVVDRAALLEAVEQQQELTDEAALAKALVIAHDEDVSRCQRLIALWMQQSGSKPVSLLQLQQALGMPLIEVWLGLLLGGQEQYQWETSGGFYYDAQNILLFAH